MDPLKNSVADGHVMIVNVLFLLLHSAISSNYSK